MIGDSKQTVQYLFDSLFPYKGAIELGRWHDGLAQIEYRLSIGLAVPYRIVNVAVFNAESLFPEVTDPTLSESQIREQRAKDARLKNFSESEREEYFEKVSQEFRDQILSMTEEEEERMDEENDAVWNAPLDPEKVQIFLRQSYRSLAPLIKSLRPGVSLLEDLLVEFHRQKHHSQVYRAFHGFFLAWDILRVEFEGELPYQISLTKNALADLEEILGPEADKIILGIGNSEGSDELPPERRRIVRAGLNRALQANLIQVATRDALLRTIGLKLSVR